jgi:hypothetical protein
MNELKVKAKTKTTQKCEQMEGKKFDNLMFKIQENIKNYEGG